MRQLQLIAHGEPSDVIELKTVPEPALGQEDVLISIGAEGVGRVAKTA
jgi:NADPH:quinone reductase-like Zn-dependent oxidoreductase